MTDTSIKFDIICKYNAKTESYTGTVSSLGIEVEDCYSEGEVFDTCLAEVRRIFNNVMHTDRGDRIEFQTGKMSVKMELTMRAMKNKTLDQFGGEDAAEVQA